MSWHGKYHKGAMRERRQIKRLDAFDRDLTFKMNKVETPEERLLVAIFGDLPVAESEGPGPEYAFELNDAADFRMNTYWLT